MAKTLGVREAAREFGLSETLIYNAVTRGQLPGVTRLGRRIILNRRLFEEFLEGQTVVDKNRLVARDALQVEADIHHAHQDLAKAAAGEKPNLRGRLYQRKATGRPTKRTAPTSRTIPDFVITVIESFAGEGMSAKEIWRRLGGKKTGEETMHDGHVFRMPSQWTINKYARLYKENKLGYSIKPGGYIRNPKGVRHTPHSPHTETTTTVQQETNEVNRHRITIGNTFDCVNCGERFKKNHRLILTAMQGLKPKTDQQKSQGRDTGDPRLTSYALCGASCLIEFTTKKEQEQWILTPLRSKEDLETTTTTAGGRRSILRRLRDLAGGKE